VSGNTARVLVRAVPDGTPTAHVIRQLDIAAVAAADTKQFAQPPSVVQFCDLPPYDGQHLPD